MLERKETFRGAGSDGKLYIVENWTESYGEHTPAESRDVYQTLDGSPVEAKGDDTFLIPTTGVTLRREFVGG